MLGLPPPLTLFERAMFRIGIFRKNDSHTHGELGATRGPFYVYPRHMWRYMLQHEPPLVFFRNLPHVIKWLPGSLLPRRWGFRFLIVEFGQRG